jgi:hypothetical protein
MLDSVPRRRVAWSDLRGLAIQAALLAIRRIDYWATDAMSAVMSERGSRHGGTLLDA